MTPLEILKAGRELISDPDRWTQRDYAFDDEGNLCDALDKAAICWCSLGALKKVTGRGNEELSTKDAKAALRFLRTATNNEYIDVFNDEHTHEEVLAAWDRAITLAEEYERDQVQ